MKIKILQANLNTSSTAHSALELAVKAGGFDLCIISEPNQNIATKKQSKNWIYHKGGSAAIWWTQKNKNLSIDSVTTTTNYITAKLSNGIYVLSCYYSPNKTNDEFRNFLIELSEQVERAVTNKIIIAGDFNAKSPAWGGTETTNRGRMVSEFASEHNMMILNTGHRPTLERIDGESYIDLTMVGEQIKDRAENWRVLTEETLSDHNYIAFDVEDGTRPKRRPKIGRIDLRYVNIPQLTKEIKKQTRNPNTGSNTGSLISFLQTASNKAKIGKHVNTDEKPPIYWWTKEIGERRNTTIKARRELSRGRKKFRQGNITQTELLTRQMRYKEPR